MFIRSLLLLPALMSLSHATEIRVFPEAERLAMLKAYHARLSAARPIPVDGWRDQQAALRQRILHDFGLDPLPPRGPLDLTRGPKIERDDCTITRVYFQTFPGFYATAFLYLPKRATFPAPAVLHPHGHWGNWSADDIVQARCINLARRGYVSLAIQYEHFDDLPSGLTMRGVFLWNNMRGLDVLESLPEVDKTRLGVTGASGGGMQTMDLAALDPRVAAAAIGVYPEYYHRQLWPHVADDTDRCHFAPSGALRYMDEHWLVALIAPRPAVVFTVTGDWTAQTIDQELPEVAAVYDLFDAPAGPKLENVTGNQPYRLLANRTGRFLAERWEGPHDYTRAMRERMAWWFDWWLRGKHEPAPQPEGDLALEKPATLQELRWTKPKGHQWSDANLAAVVRSPAFRRPPFTKAVLTELLGETIPTPLESKSLGRESVAGWDVEKLWFTSEPDVKIPALLVHPARRAPGKGSADFQSAVSPTSSRQNSASTERQRIGNPRYSRLETCATNRIVILVAPNGKNDIFVEPYRTICQTALAEGRAVLALDMRLRGEWAWTMTPPGIVPPITWRNNAVVWGRPELGMAATDIRRALDYLATRQDCSLESLRVVGTGFAALCAAALDDRIAECVVDCQRTDLERARLLPGSLRRGDIGDIAALVAPRRLELRNVHPLTPLPAGRHLTVQQAAEGEPVGLAEPLEVAPGQSVESDAIPVRPLHDYRLRARIRKPWQATLNIHLQRGDERFHLAALQDECLAFEEREFDFLTKPNQSSLRLAFSATAPVQVESVRLLANGPVVPPQPDGRELLCVTNFASVSEISRQSSPTNCFIGYGPGATVSLRADPPLARLKHGENYVAFCVPLVGPLQRGGTYRFSVVARGQGTLSMNFWHIPPHLSPRAQFELRDDWQTCAVNFFVEAKPQQTALPTVAVTGTADVDSVSLKLVAVAAP